MSLYKQEPKRWEQLFFVDARVYEKNDADAIADALAVGGGHPAFPDPYEKGGTNCGVSPGMS